MLLKINAVRDSTDHRSQVISCSLLHDVNGKPIALLGDQVDFLQYYPGAKPHVVNKIITAHPILSVGGVTMAVEDCFTECGCNSIGMRRDSAD